MSNFAQCHQAIEAATPVLKAMSKEIVHLGPVGSRAKMKLINNSLCGVQVASLAEGLTWIERSGLDPQKALSILNSGAPARSKFTGRNIE
jgi:3-hydroxyisobutyrate dehydrogenase